MFREGAKDAEADMRQNSLFGLGELVLFSGPCLEPQYNQILSDLSLVLANETAPQVNISISSIGSKQINIGWIRTGSQPFWKIMYSIVLYPVFYEF